MITVEEPPTDFISERLVAKNDLCCGKLRNSQNESFESRLSRDG